MAYPNYFPTNYPYFPTSFPNPAATPAAPAVTPSGPVGNGQQATNNGIIWVQGEAGAKSFLVAPGQSVLLMDSEQSSFYIKSSDSSGMPQPLRIFDYTERKTEATAKAPDKAEEYVTRTEFEKRLAELTEGGDGVG